MKRFFGRKDFTWFVGVVEDVNDPVQLGRVRVRCFGWHSEDTNEVPTNSLPWAVPLNPVSSASSLGVGESPTGLLVGSWVVGFFMDGERAQEPILMGSINSTQGEELDTNKLALGEQTKTYTPDSVISEPADPYDAIYPYNKVKETESGHVKEYDDTPDAERIRELHKSGTFYQVHPDGTLSTHIVKDRYTLIVEDDSIHVKGNVKIVIDKNLDVDVGGTCNIHSDGKMSFDAPEIHFNENR